MWVVSTHTLFYAFPYYARYVAAAGINNYPTLCERWGIWLVYFIQNTIKNKKKSNRQNNNKVKWIWEDAEVVVVIKN